MTILEIYFPENFSEKYQEYHGVLLDILRNKEPQLIVQEVNVFSKADGADSKNHPSKKSRNRSGSKSKIIIDFQKGIYSEKYPKSVYEISGKRKKLLEYLCNNQSAHIRDLIAVTGQKDDLIMQEIRKINDIFKKFCKTNKHLIIHNTTGGGYMINRETLDIEVIKTFT